MTKKETNKKFEAVDQTTKITQIIDGGISSVEIKNTSKGVNIAVKVYQENPINAQKMADTIYTNLAKKYKVVTLE